MVNIELIRRQMDIALSRPDNKYGYVWVNADAVRQTVESLIEEIDELGRQLREAHVTIRTLVR